MDYSILSPRSPPVPWDRTGSEPKKEDDQPLREDLLSVVRPGPPVPTAHQPKIRSLCRGGLTEGTVTTPRWDQRNRPGDKVSLPVAKEVEVALPGPLVCTSSIGGTGDIGGRYTGFSPSPTHTRG